MMEERYHATTQNRFYPDMSNVNKNITVGRGGGKTYQPAYVYVTGELWLVSNRRGTIGSLYDTTLLMENNGHC